MSEIHNTDDLNRVPERNRERNAKNAYGMWSIQIDGTVDAIYGASIAYHSFAEHRDAYPDHDTIKGDITEALSNALYLGRHHLRTLGERIKADNDLDDARRDTLLDSIHDTLTRTADLI